MSSPQRIDATNATQAIQDVLRSLPPGLNPWDGLRLALSSQVNWSVSREFRPQLWTLLIVIFLALLQGFIWKTIEKSNGHEAHYIVLWETLTWIPGWLAFWFATMSLITAHVLHRDSSGRPYRSFWSSAAVSNGATWGMPVMMIVLIITLSAKAQIEYDGVRDQYAQLLELLTRASDSFDGAIDVSIIQQGTASTQAFLDHMSTFIRFFRAVFFAYTGLTLLLMILYGTVSYLHLAELSRTIEGLATSRRTSDDADDTTTQEQLYRTYSILVRLTILICLMLALFSSLFLFVAASGRRAVTDQAHLQAGHLLPAYTFSILGLPITLLLLHRALTSNPAHGSRIDHSERHQQQHSSGHFNSKLPIEIESNLQSSASSPFVAKESIPLHSLGFQHSSSASPVHVGLPLQQQPAQYDSLPPRGQLPNHMQAAQLPPSTGRVAAEPM
ncbi:hypothetical protein OIO90_003721 [Microbotryomycetes sp. JL221]|nr:hypothetical protein OIO90_003721 [Microbotryomycetes sp. JL221]